MTTVTRVSSPGSGLIKLWDQASCKEDLRDQKLFKLEWGGGEIGGILSFFSVDYGGLERSKGGQGVFFDKSKKPLICHILVLCFKGGPEFF